MNETSSLDTQINRFRMMGNHESGCNSLKPQPKQEGFQYDVYIVMHCDCFLALKNPTQQEKVKFVRHMGTRFGGVHARTCNTSNPIQELYRGKMVWVTRNCTCWLAEVDKPAKPAYTEPMTTDPLVAEIRAKVHEVRANALGPHLDTPIYDQLAREYDKRYNTMNYFETALAQKLKRMGQRHL